jgi:putative aldouronate transport system permease protein
MRSGKNYALALEIDALKAKKKSLVENLKTAKQQNNGSDINAATLALDTVNADLKAKQKAYKKSENQVLLADINRHKFIYLMLIIPLVYYFIFKYIPVWNAQIAFRDFVSLKKTGITGGKWVGLQNFKTFITSYYFWDLIRNTLMYSFGKLLVSLPLSIILAIAIYECTCAPLRKIVQTLSYLPHFLSWVIMYGILLSLLSPSQGILNDIIKLFGGTPKNFLTDPTAFPIIVILSDAWKEMGWSAIIFIAALMGIDGTLFEAATVEGANSWQRVRYITLPAIKPVIVVVLLMKIGTILDAGFNQLYMLYSPSVYSVGDIIDTWVYRGTINGQFSLATAAGIFKGIIGMTLLFVSNWASKKFTENSLF